jgi:membrane protein implicated in regulation of membrane protease activity
VRLRRVYFGVGLGGLALLILGTVLVWLAGGDAYGLLLLTEYWIMLCLAAGLILLFATALRRLATRRVKPS